MSGGRFEYKEWHIDNIRESIENVIERNGVKLSHDEFKDRYRYCYVLPDENGDFYDYDYPDDIIELFKRSIPILKAAYIYAKRIDYLLSGDDGEDSFKRRLKDELKKEGIENGIII